MERGLRAGAVLVVLGAPPAAGEELSGVFQELSTSECHFINGTDRVRFVERSLYNRQQYAHFDSDVGVLVGDTPYGEEIAKIWNSSSNWLEEARAQAIMFCRPNCKLPRRFLLRWFQDGQELPERVVATDVVPNGDWTYQVLVMLEIPPRRGVTSPCQVEHVSLEHPLSWHWEMLQDTVQSKILVGIGPEALPRDTWGGPARPLCLHRPALPRQERGGIPEEGDGEGGAARTRRGGGAPFRSQGLLEPSP